MAFYSWVYHRTIHLYQLRNAILNHPPNPLPPHNKNIPLPPPHNGVLVRAPSPDLGVAQQPHEHSRLGVGPVDHARAARRVVEAAELRREGGEEGGEVVRVEEGGVVGCVGGFGGREVGC